MEEKFDRVIEQLEENKIEINASDFGLSERDHTDQEWFSREYLCRPVDGYGYGSTRTSDIPININDPRNYSYYYSHNMYGYDRTLYLRDGENPVYRVQPAVINIDRDWDDWNMIEQNFCYYRPSIVKFEVCCPSCNGRNEITVAEYIIIRNPNPHLVCVCGATLILELGR